ncbi:MAG: vWA domain-containing protein [Planctomycetota bacterium]
MSKIGEWGASLAVHALLLLALLTMHVENSTKPALVQVVSSITEPPQTEDFLEVVPDLDEEISLNESVSLLPKSSASVAAAQAPMPGEMLQTNVEQGALARVRDPSLNRPLASIGSSIKLGENVEGVRGTNLSAGSDAGSVDRLTMEILRQLEKSKVLVAWVMDASGSMSQRRGDVIKRFERIYHELGELDKGKEEILLTSIISFGNKTEFMTPKPTANMDEIRKAVHAIKIDDSGKENVFSAVKETCLKLRRYQTQSGRKLMIIVLTDEKGDDPSLVDDTVKLVTRNRTPVYVLGPMAPFCRKTVDVPYREPESGEVFMLPVEKGPETIQVEQISLPYWGAGPQYDLLPSGFGPYDLTRLARESGGIYFMYDDGSSGRGEFNNYRIGPLFTHVRVDGGIPQRDRRPSASPGNRAGRRG